MSSCAHSELHYQASTFASHGIFQLYGPLFMSLKRVPQVICYFMDCESFARRTFTTPKIRTFTTPKFGHLPPPKTVHLPGGQLPPPISFSSFSGALFLAFSTYSSWMPSTSPSPYHHHPSLSPSPLPLPSKRLTFGQSVELQ